MKDPCSEPPAQNSLDAWMASVGPRALAYAASLVNDRHLAEDIVQDCFCRLLQKRDKYNLQRDGTRILFRSITNACINASTRRKPVLSLNQRREDNEASWDVSDRKTPPPDGALANRELLDAIDVALKKLPMKHRAALQLKSLGHTQEEIAEALGVTSSHAGVLVHRARLVMAEYLAPFLGEPSP